LPATHNRVCPEEEEEQEEFRLDDSSVASSSITGQTPARKRRASILSTTSSHAALAAVIGLSAGTCGKNSDSTSQNGHQNSRLSQARAGLKKTALGALAEGGGLVMYDRAIPVRILFRAMGWWDRLAADIIATGISLAFLWLIPFQIAFDLDVSFDALYAVGYALDFALIGCCLPSALAAARKLRRSMRDDGSVRNSMVYKARRAALVSRLVWSLVRTTMGLPYDAVLWPTSHRAYIPVMRLTRLTFAPGHVHMALKSLERSQTMPFTLARSVRVIVVFCLAVHWGGCLFFLFTRVEGAVQ
jgi:hypothetical protein